MSSKDTLDPTQDLPGWVAAVRAVSRLLGVVAAFMIVVSIVVVCQMVFVRTVLGESSIWQTEFVMYLLVAATFIGAPYILLTRGHVAVDIVPLMVRPRVRRHLHLLGSLIGLVFCGLFLYAALPWWYGAWTTGETTSSMWRARLWIPYLSVPVGLTVLCLQYLSEMWLVLTEADHPFGLSPDDTL